MACCYMVCVFVLKENKDWYYAMLYAPLALWVINRGPMVPIYHEIIYRQKTF